MNKQKNAFTLVELIVVITILAILWTIAFISLQWYSKDARDSIRNSDISNIKTSLELFHLNSWKYPLPDDNEVVDYGTEILWYQWVFWSSVISSLSRSMSEIPTDPLTDKKYIFSVANNKNEFEILSLLEWDWVALNNLAQTNAASLEVTPKIDGTYNRVFIKTASYIVPVPSIINTEVWDVTMTLDSNNITSQVVNWWENIPEQWNVISNTWALTWLVLSVYTWSIAINDSNAAKETVIQKIKEAYTGSILAASDIYEYILATNWTEEIVWALNTIVLKDDTTEVTVVANTCDDSTKPVDDLNKVYTVNPTSVNQAYVQDDVECWYICTWWYTWVNCEIAAPLITSTDCINAWWLWVDSADDIYIWSTQSTTWFCISPRVWDFWDSDWNGISWNGWWDSAVANSNWWDASAIDDSWNPDTNIWQTRFLDSDWWYTCKSLWSSATDYITTDNLAWRMEWIAINKSSLSELQNIEWVQNATPPNGHSTPALFIADCIDWVKDLWTIMTYTHNENTEFTITYADYNVDKTTSDQSWTYTWCETTSTANADKDCIIYQNRQRYLIAWTQKSGSHLPSAMSYISNWFASASDADGDFLTTTSRWEYQVACDAGDLVDSDQSALEWMWLSAIGSPLGEHWWRNARLTWYNWCSDMGSRDTGYRNESRSTRFVIRP